MGRCGLVLSKGIAMSALCAGQLREQSFSVILAGRQHEFDSFQSAISALAACGIIRSDDDDLEWDDAEDTACAASLPHQTRSS